MKFEKMEGKVKWTSQTIYKQILIVRDDIANHNRAMHKLDSQVNVLKEKKKQVQKKTANKWRYLRQLEKDFAELSSNIE